MYMCAYHYILVHNNDKYSHVFLKCKACTHSYKSSLFCIVVCICWRDWGLSWEDGAEVPQNQKEKIIFCCMQRKLMLLGEERMDLELLGRFSRLIYDKNQ